MPRSTHLCLFLRLLGPVASHLLIGDVFKNHKGSYLELFTYKFATYQICFSTCPRKMYAAVELNGEPLSRWHHCGFSSGHIGLCQAYIAKLLLRFMHLYNWVNAHYTALIFVAAIKFFSNWFSKCFASQINTRLELRNRLHCTLCMKQCENTCIP